MMDDLARDIGKFLKFALYAIPALIVVVIGLIVALVIALR